MLCLATAARQSRVPPPSPTACSSGFTVLPQHNAVRTHTSPNRHLLGFKTHNPPKTSFHNAWGCYQLTVIQAGKLMLMSATGDVISQIFPQDFKVLWQRTASQLCFNALPVQQVTCNQRIGNLIQGHKFPKRHSVMGLLEWYEDWLKR